MAWKNQEGFGIHYLIFLLLLSNKQHYLSRAQEKGFREHEDEVKGAGSGDEDSTQENLSLSNAKGSWNWLL